jgi:hypothetical protein
MGVHGPHFFVPAVIAHRQEARKVASIGASVVTVLCGANISLAALSNARWPHVMARCATWAKALRAGIDNLGKPPLVLVPIWY